MSITTEWAFIKGNASQENAIRARLNSGTPEFQIFVDGKYQGNGGVDSDYVSEWYFIYGTPGTNYATRLRANAGNIEIQQWVDGAFVGHGGISSVATTPYIFLRGASQKSGDINIMMRIFSGVPEVSHYANGAWIGAVLGETMPTYFGWDPEFTVYGSGTGGFATTFDFAGSKPSGTAMWCSPSGNDTTGDGSESTPYKTPQKCITEGATVVNMKAGDYFRSDGLDVSFASSSDVALVAVDGPGTVFLSRAVKGDSLSWTDEGSDTYSATRANVRTVLDRDEAGHATKTLTDGVTPVPVPADEVADLAATQADNGHAWAQVSTTLYVQTHDQREPDEDVIIILIEELTEFLDDNITFYADGIEWWGDQPVFFDFNIVNTALFVGIDCGYRYSGDFDNFYVDGCDRVRLLRCKTSHQLSSDDGFNYERNSVNPTRCTFLEVDCEGFANGDSTNDNGSTSHDFGVYGIRVNGDYSSNPGPGVADSSGARVINYGVTADDNGNYGIQVGTYSTVNPAMQWNKGCSTSNNGTDGRNRSTGGLSFDLGGNTWQAGDKKSSNNYVDVVANPDLETILTVAPDSIIGFYCVLDTDMYCQILTDEVDDFFDVSANKMNATRRDTNNRASYSATQVNGKPGWSTGDTSNDDDAAYDLAKTASVFGLSMIGMYGDGTETAFAGFHCLLTGSSSDTPRIMGSNNNNALHSSGDFADGFSRDGGAEDASPLPMPLDWYDAESDTGAAQSSDYTILGSNTHTDGRAWYSDNMGAIILRNRAWTEAEELAIRTAGKSLFGVT